MMQASAASVEEEPAPPKPEEHDIESASKATPSAPSAPTAPAKASVPAEPALDADKCMEMIWEQLIAAPPSRGRSMSTVVLKDTKVLLSSWRAGRSRRIYAGPWWRVRYFLWVLSSENARAIRRRSYPRLSWPEASSPIFRDASSEQSAARIRKPP